MSRLDKYRRSHGTKSTAGKLDLRALERRQRHIAMEAARRLPQIVGLSDEGDLAKSPAQADYYAAKMQAVAVLGLTVKPGELPSDELVMELFTENFQVDGHSISDQNIQDEAQDQIPDPEPDATDVEIHDRFSYYESLLKPLEKVKQNPKTHPEGDALYHSLQVFELVWQNNPYDEELLTAALLHDVGKAIAPHGDHHAATIHALEGRITERTRELIEKLLNGLAYHSGTLGHRARKALINDPDWEAVTLLTDSDLSGRRPGAQVPTLQEAIDRIRTLSDESGEPV